jgi:hypothetical protein
LRRPLGKPKKDDAPTGVGAARRMRSEIAHHRMISATCRFDVIGCEQKDTSKWKSGNPLNAAARMGGHRSSIVEYAFERQMGFYNRGLQHDKTEVFVDADVHFDKTFHDCLVIADTCCDEFHEIIVSA